MKIYTDASLNSKNGICGIGLYVVPDNSKPYTISYWIESNDNNFAEMQAIYTASILGHGKNCTIYTDSQCAIAYINNNVKEKPRTREQYERHQRLRLMGYKIRKLKPNLQWVKGHTKHFQTHSIGNQMADTLAKQGITKYLER